jgi:glutathione synthase
MSHRFVFIMDPIADIDIGGDSSFALMLEAQSRNHTVYVAELSDLELLGSDAWARLKRVVVRETQDDHYTIESDERCRLNDVQAIFMRKDPPIETEYFAATHILDFVDRQKTVMINDPQSLRDCNEKIFAMYWPELMPSTLVARSIQRLKDFIESEADVILKPLNTSGGAGIIRIKHQDKNISSILEMMTNQGRVAITAQTYLPKVDQGDRRIILLDGQAIGVINRRASDNDLRSNMHVGGRVEAAELNDRDREICSALAPELVRRNLPFVGIDVIGGLLTEINVTSPTGFRELKELSGVDGASMLIDWIEKRLESM